MAVDRERLRERLHHVREQMAISQPLAADGRLPAQRVGDPRSHGGMVRSVQTSVEAIDVTFHLCAKPYAREPQSAGDALEILARRGDIPATFLPCVRRMVRLRDVVVQGYLQTDARVVERIVADHRGDFATWESRVRAIADRSGGVPVGSA